MSNIIYSTSNKEDMYLIKAFKNQYYLVNIKLPTESSTIKEYLDWLSKYLTNAICLNNSYTPQQFNHSGIEEFVAFSDIIDEAAKIANVELEDYIIPFLGGIKGFDFRELLQRLWKSEYMVTKGSTNNGFWDYRHLIRSYFLELFKDD